MAFKNLASIAFLACTLIGAWAQQTPAASASTGAPKIQFADPVFDFGRIKSGDLAKHIYYFTNVGTAVLEVPNVHPSCGCTTAGEWTKRVEPGETGTLAIQFNSLNFRGPVLKTISVTSNDKTQPVVILQLKGTIWKPIDAAPEYAVLNIPPDATQGSAIVTITNNMEEAVELFNPVSNNPSITAVLKTNVPGRSFQVEVAASKPMAAGNVQAQIEIKTSSTIMPVVIIRAWANVQAPVAIMPPQITLPAPPLQVKAQPTVTIQNYSTNALNVTEPSLNLEGVEVNLQEVRPGRTFTVTLGFPQGFEMPAGQSPVLTVKTSHPDFPVLKVPIRQMPRMTPAAASAVPPISAPAGH
ncbi:MAG TPA: DUF1573 domain-containing protein [Clostridia bacterium]|nr:DUF1573 domain-containing protein [Clostridia bacterium]